MDYSLLIQDKAMKGLLSESKLLKNRLLIGKANVESRVERAVEAERASITAKTSQPKKYNAKTQPILRRGWWGFQVHLVLLGQRPLAPISQETIRTDYAILEDQNVPKWLDFSRLYFFQIRKFR